MKDATQGVLAAVVLKIDFASPEATIQSFCDVDDHLTSLLTTKTAELCDAKLSHDKTRANAEVAIRNAAASSGNKVTEGYVSALIDKDDDVGGTRAKSDRLECEVSSLRAAIASLERKHSLFKNWLAGQRPIGLNER